MDAHDPRQRRRDVWSRYWAAGALHSCGQTFEGNYPGSIRDFWAGAFGPLAGGARVLDIATGNGPLPRLLLDLRPGASVACDAIDLARVAPAWLDALPGEDRGRIHFHPGIEAESLPFEDGRFDLVVSQYGLEYSDTKRSVPELLRVLAPGGRVRLLVHHAGSRPVQLAREEIGHIDWLQAPGGYLDAALAMLAPMALAGTPEGRRALAADPAAALARAGFDDTRLRLQQRMDASDCPDVLAEVAEAVVGAFQASQAGGAVRGIEVLDALRARLADARVRLVELVDCARDEAGIAALCAALESGGRPAARAEPINFDGHLMAWAVSAG